MFRIAFERCIELDPENIDAQAALAVLQMTSPQSDEEMRSGIFTLGSLYKKEKDHPLILNHLANHFFIKSVIYFESALVISFIFVLGD